MVAPTFTSQASYPTVLMIASNFAVMCIYTLCMNPSLSNCYTQTFVHTYAHCSGSCTLRKKEVEFNNNMDQTVSIWHMAWLHTHTDQPMFICHHLLCIPFFLCLFLLLFLPKPLSSLTLLAYDSFPKYPTVSSVWSQNTLPWYPSNYFISSFFFPACSLWTFL